MPPRPRAALLLGHGAGGWVEAPDLLAAADAALEAGVSVARIEQPYRVAGRRSAAPAPQLDAAWLAVNAALPPTARSPACRSSPAAARQARASLAGRRRRPAPSASCASPSRSIRPSAGRDRAKTRLPELEAVTVPMLIVQGESDPFGMPPAGPARTVVTVAGNHSLRTGLTEVGPAVSSWLASLPI